VIEATSQRRLPPLVTRFVGVRRRLTTTVTAGVASQGALVVSGALIARSLGVSNRGHLALFQLIPLLITVLGGLGLPIALTFAIAGRPAAAGTIVDRLRRLVLGQAVALTALHVVILAVVLSGASPAVRRAGWISVVLVPALLAQTYGQAILQGRQSFRLFNVVRLLPAASYAVLVVAAFAGGVRSLAAFTAIWSSTAVACGLVAVVLSLRGAGHDPADAEPRALVSFGLRGLLGSASPIESFQLDQIIVAAALSSRDLGLYVVGAGFTSLPRLVAQSVGMVAYPDIAAQEDAEARASRLRSYSWLTAGLSLIVVAALAVAAPTIVPLFFGSAFRPAAPIAQLLLVSSLFLAVRRVVIDGARGLGRAGLGTAAEIVFLVVLVPLLALFVPRWHTQGVAAALAVAGAASLGAALAFLRWPQLRIPRSALATAPRAAAVVVPLFAVACLAPPLRNATGATRTTLVAFLAAGVMATALYPFAVRLLTRRFDLFEPLLTGNVLLLTLFGIRPIAMILNHQQLDYDRVYLPSFVFTMGIALLGTYSFVLAHELSFPRWRARTLGRLMVVRRQRARLFALVATGAGIVLFALFLAARGSMSSTIHLVLAGRSKELETVFSNSSEYLTSAPLLGGCAAIVVALAAGPAYLRFRDWLLIVVCALFPVVYFFVIGGRRFLLPIIAIPLIVRYLERRRRPSWVAIAVVVPLAFLLLATIVLTRSANARSAYGGVSGILVHAVERPDDPARLFFTGPDTDMLPNLALEVRNLSRDGGYFYGRATLGDLLIAPIPHKILHAKPQTARNEILERVFGGPCQPNKGLCPDFSALGTFYQDFWVPGVVLGMAALGLATSFFWARHKASDRDPVRIMFAATWYVMLPIVIRAGFNPAVQWFLYFAVPTWVGIRFALRIGRRDPTAAAAPVRV
jgi:PST family polysaccharide transporter